MGSLFKDVDLFGSGPHTMTELRRGRRVVSLSALSGDVTAEGTAEFGDYETRVEVRGRLIADTDEALWDLRDAIVAESESSIGSGVLEDTHGRQWTAMKLLNFEPGGAVEHGRKVSVGYVVEFGQLASG